MSLAIRKYAVPVNRTFQLTMPEGAKILTIQAQRGEPQIWALVDTKATPKPYVFIMLPTGDANVLEHTVGEFMAGRQYVDTFQISGGDLVFHLFMEK